MNTLPFAKPSDLLLRRADLPLPAAAAHRGRARRSGAPFAAGERRVRLRLRLLDPPARRRRTQRVEQEGTCTTPTGESVTFRVNDPDGGAGARRPGLRRRALGPVHHGRPRGAEDDRDPASWRSPTRARSSSTARTSSSLVVEIDTGAPGGRDAGRRRRRDADPRQVQRPDRTRRAPRGEEHDARARSSSTRSTGTSRSATSTTWRTRSTSATSYPGAYRARLNANLAFWDGLDGKVDWPPDEDGNHPLTELVLADFLVVDVTKPYVEQGSFLEIELAARRGEPHRDLRRTDAQRRRDGHDLHPARSTPATARPSATASTTPPARHRARSPTWRAPNPDPPEPPEHHH